MAYRHVDLAAIGTSGDGSTWNDDSSGTAVYVGVAGWVSAVNASSAGDIVFVKNNGTSGSSAFPSIGTSLANERNPPQVYGVKTGTTNLGASVVTADLVDGIAADGGTSRAYDNTPPTLTVTGASDITFGACLYIYGMKFVSDDNLAITSGAGIRVTLEECHIKVTSGTDQLNAEEGGRTTLIRCLVDKGPGDIGTSAGNFWDNVEVYDCEILSTFEGVWNGGGRTVLDCCDVRDGNQTGILNSGSQGAGCFVTTKNCQFETSWTILTGAEQISRRFENFGSDDTAGLTTSGSEQQYNYHDEAGDVVVETTIVRTGGADDGATGGFSYDYTTAASSTVVGVRGLAGPWMNFWIAGDGTSQTVSVFFTSDNGNAQSADWTDDEVWLEIAYPSETGLSKYDTKSSRMQLLDTTPGALNSETDGDWPGVGSSTKNAQSASVSISPDYEGLARVKLVFAPGANAETIYVDPEPVVT